MNERFQIAELHICTFSFENNFISPDLENYPRRICVIDKQNKIVIDINHKLKYDYIETISGLYFINESMKKIKDGRRSAIFPSTIFLDDIKDKKILESAKKIIEGLKSEKQYTDGNEFLNNEQYLKKVKEEKNDKQKEKTKKLENLFTKR